MPFCACTYTHTRCRSSLGEIFSSSASTLFHLQLRDSRLTQKKWVWGSIHTSSLETFIYNFYRSKNWHENHQRHVGASCCRFRGTELTQAASHCLTIEQTETKNSFKITRHKTSSTYYNNCLLLLLLHTPRASFPLPISIVFSLSRSLHATLKDIKCICRKSFFFAYLKEFNSI